MSKVGVSLFAVTILAGSAISAPSPLTGKWHGHIRFDRVGLKPLKNPQRNAARLKTLSRIEQTIVTLILKPDQTFRMTGVLKGAKTQIVEGS